MDTQLLGGVLLAAEPAVSGCAFEHAVVVPLWPIPRRTVLVLGKYRISNLKVSTQAMG